MSKKLTKNSFIQGTLVTSIFLILIKIMGALYVIPFYQIIGEDGGTLYSYAYNIYILFLNISTAGIPVAMSMIIAEYLTLEKYEAKQRAQKIGTILVAVLAIVSFLLVFFGSPLLARYLLARDAEENVAIDTSIISVSNVSLVIKVTSFCLLIIPFLSVLRGYLQGHKFITITSFSQVIEQVVRIIVVLVGSYISIRLLKLSVTTGVSFALSGAFFGGLVAFLYLKLKVKKNQDAFEKPTKKDDVSNQTILKKIALYCLPIVLISIINDIYTLVDIHLIVKGLNGVGFVGDESKVISSIIATWAPKICTLIIAISTALITSIIPNVTECYTKKDYEGVNHRINQALSTMLVVAIPMAVLLFMLSRESYFIFYGASQYGTLILSFSAISHIFFGIWSVLNSVLQSLKKFKIVYLNSICGLVINALIDIPMIRLLYSLGLPAYIGTILATIIGYMVSTAIVLVYLRRTMNFKFGNTLKVLKKTVVPLCAIVVFNMIVRKIIYIEEYRKITALIYLGINGCIGTGIYLVYTYKNHLLEEVFGKEFLEKIGRKLHI